jgi:hypothetical protein
VMGMTATFCPARASVGTVAADEADGGGTVGAGCCAPAAQLNDSSARITAKVGFTAGK